MCWKFWFVFNVWEGVLHANTATFYTDTSWKEKERRENTVWFLIFSWSFTWIFLSLHSFTFSVRDSVFTKAQSLTSSPIWRLWAFIVLPTTTLQTSVCPPHMYSRICCTLLRRILNVSNSVIICVSLFFPLVQSLKWHQGNMETWTLCCLKQSKVECVH